MIYGMKLHEKIIIDRDISTLRVPGGWIYNCLGLFVFVPFNDEFSKKGRVNLMDLAEREMPDKDADYDELEHQTEGYK